MSDEQRKPSGTTLHLLEPPRAAGRGRESSLFAWSELRRLGRVEPGPVVLVGDGMSARWAAAHGIEPDARLTPPAGRSGLLWPRLRRLARDVRPDAIRCWSPDLLRACALAPGLHGTELRGTVVEGPNARDRRLRGRLRRATVIETFDERDAEDWRSLGLTVRTVELGDSPAPTPSDDRAALQAQIGVSSDELLLGTLFDHPADTDARRFSFLLAILAVSEHDAVGVVPSGARRIEAGRRYARVINREYRVLESDAPLIEQLRALDACVIPDPTRRLPRGADLLLRRAAARAGVRAYERPAYLGVSGPTAPEMIRPMLDVLEGAA